VRCARSDEGVEVVEVVLGLDKCAIQRQLPVARPVRVVPLGPFDRGEAIAVVGDGFDVDLQIT
jgi:hypothetical protein